jgi:UDP-2,3-diacylglucosamine pyrophosphatase LpxH
MKQPLTILQISDLHLGHRHTPTQHIIDNLNEAIPNHAEFGQIDLLLITGDVFDDLLSLPDTNVFIIRLWITRVLRLCKKYDVVLRVLEGTPSHDWKQSKLFTHLNELIGIGADVHYADTLSIEYIERFDLTVLYCPDEWKPTCDEIWADVRALLNAHHCEQVDIALVHGAFEHQLPPQARLNTHRIERYCSITRYLVFIGHIHFHSVNERVVCPGSFDRLAHGEEKAKGYIKATLYPSGTYEVMFIENKNAYCYRTINGCDLTPEAFYQQALAQLSALPQQAQIRFIVPRDEAMFLKIDALKQQFPLMSFKREIKTTTHTTLPSTTLLDTPQVSMVLTPTTLPDLLLERLDHVDLTPALQQRAKELLHGVLSDSRTTA